LDLDIFLLSSNASTYECQTIYIVLVWLDFSFYATYLEYLMAILYMFECTLVHMTNLCKYQMSRRGTLGWVYFRFKKIDFFFVFLKMGLTKLFFKILKKKLYSFFLNW
jgi:hypothetical protein